MTADKDTNSMNDTRALAGIRVADFTQIMSGPTGTMLLADFGADVTKIEPPIGDGSRRWGSNRFGDKEQFSALYLSLNRNKRSIALDLKSPDGLAVAKRIIAQSDVLVENFKPGVMKRLGLDYETLSAIDPRLVYCSISGFGQTGPLSDRPGYDQLMQAYAGLLSITGEEGRPAVRIGPTAIDILTGTHGAFAIMVALRERDRSGKGQYIDTSLYESALHLMTQWICDYTGSGKMLGRSGPYFPFTAPYGIFLASDREFYMGVGNDKMWVKFCDAIERPDLPKDPRFTSNRLRAGNQKELYVILEPILKSKPVAHWIEIAERLDIPYSLITNLSEVVEQEQAKAREAIVPIEGLDKAKTAGLPMKLSRTPAEIRTPPPELGGNSDAILDELGFGAAEIARMRAAGAVL
jgi:crotonobetainyl-CoA:carnitine CoA-transferase CaiB-like acyl-CoA transferase